MSRGEYDPYPLATDEVQKFHWVKTISNSAWLQERYGYEKMYYGRSYNFDGNVEEMLSEFSHYVFSFHDQFIEVLASGIWFEFGDVMLGTRTPETDHPLAGLNQLKAFERFEAFGITCQLRRNPLSIEELEHRARLCSQTIFEIGAELDGKCNTSWRLTYRVRDGIGKSFLRGYFRNAVEKYEGIPSFSTIKPKIDQWLCDVRGRRQKMGKT